MELRKQIKNETIIISYGLKYHSGKFNVLKNSKLERKKRITSIITSLINDPLQTIQKALCVYIYTQTYTQKNTE
jgi:hypothetical protein